MNLSPIQAKALKMVSFGVPLNLRLVFTKQTVNSLIEAGLVTQAADRMEHTITERGFDVVNQPSK